MNAEHSQPMDTERVNAEYIGRSNDLYEAMDDSRWLPKGSLEIPIPY